MQIRRALPSDAIDIATAAFAAYREDELTNWLYPRMEQYSSDVLSQRKIRARLAFLVPGTSTMIAVTEESDGFCGGSGVVVGSAVWRRNGRDERAGKWMGDALGMKINRYLLGWEKWYQERVLDRATDWKRVHHFFAESGGFPHLGSLEGYWKLDNLSVHPDMQRKGLGGKLLEWGLKTADEEGVPIILVASPHGQGLYRKHGFRTYETHVIEGLQPGHAMLREPEGHKGAWLQDESDGISRLKTIDATIET